MTYQEKLAAVKAYYPFEKWSEAFYPDENDVGGMDQYAPENCDTAAAIMNELLGNLAEAGEKAPETDKLALFEKAVENYNVMHDEIKGFIGIRQHDDLCDLFNRVTRAAGLNPVDYADGEGVTGMWREW